MPNHRPTLTASRPGFLPGLAFWTLLCLLLTAPQVTLAEALVLVVQGSSPIGSLETLDVRKAFLGLTVSAGGMPVQPLLNETQPDLHEAFLQHVVGLSDEAYRRRIDELLRQDGQQAPPSFKAQEKLLAELAANPYGVTYMWQSRASTLKQIRIVRILWHD
jgi:hypothetical protein